MKANNWQKVLAVLIVTVGVASGVAAVAQDSAGISQAATASGFVPNLSYGVAQILQLAQAKVSDDTIVAYIRNSGNSYGLNADQIIYLRQQGLSDAVLTAMLTQPRAGMAVAAPSTPAPQPVASPAYPGQVSPAAAYVQTVPDTAYYSQPYYSQPYYYSQPSYCYPAYGWCPPVTFYYGWGGGWGRGWRGGGYYGGGYRSGGFGGVAVHGGGFSGGGGHGGGHR